jgi:hypothetical protein
MTLPALSAFDWVWNIAFAAGIATLLHWQINHLLK